MSTEPAKASSLNPNDILTAEFEYISQTAFQANEDRARVTNFYLVTLVGFIAALLGIQLDNLMVPQVYWAFAALFVVLFLASTLTLLQLIRLREAWFESVKAMNAIKAYYEANLPGLILDTAFRWKATTIPAKFKPWSVGFLLALQVAVLGGASAGAAVVFFGLTQGAWAWGWAVVATLAAATGQMVLYWALLQQRSGDRKKRRLSRRLVPQRVTKKAAVPNANPRVRRSNMPSTDYPTTMRISKLADYLRAIQEAQGDWEHERVNYYPNNLWFRGQTDDWSLLPKVMRPVPDSITGANRSHNELKILETFTALYRNYVAEGLKPYSIELLAFMQHNGVPTRFLDWTESALMGLFFAVANAKPSRGLVPVVWIMAPGKLNYLSFEGLKEFAGPFLASIPSVQARIKMIGFLPNGELDTRFFEKYPHFRSLRGRLQYPLAFYPVSSHNLRLATQKGCFTVHGVQPAPIEGLFRNTDCVRYLRKIAIRPSAVAGIREELRVMGITPRSVFPDLGGLSQELSSCEYYV